MQRTIPALIDGYTDLPAGKLASLVTFMERRTPPEMAPVTRPGLAVRQVSLDAAAFLALYRRIGEQWLWFSALRLSESELTAQLAAPRTTLLVLEHDGREIGLAELAREGDGNVEIVSFGLVPEATGRGAGRILMDAALAHAFGDGATRVWLHTCSFDHPAALRFYARSGFTVWKLGIEICDDPRRLGILPLEAAPHVPLAP